jgi:protein gp37
MRMAARLEAMGSEKYSDLTRKSGGRYKWTGVVREDRSSLLAPTKWKKPKKIFVNSMSDLFHEQVSNDFIGDVLDVIRSCRQHTFQILTKRPERLRSIGVGNFWPDNLWLGTSVESQAVSYRIDELRSAHPAVAFLSLEPLIAPIPNLDLTNIDWVIVGGESGPNARPVNASWITDIRDRCIETETAFHFKQWGGVNKKKYGRELDGRTWDEYPKSSRIS